MNRQERWKPLRFVGRGDDIVALEAILLSDHHDLIDVIGPPGVGKRALVAFVIARNAVQQRYAGGIFTCSERSFRPWLTGLAAYRSSGPAFPDAGAGHLRDALIVIDAGPTSRWLHDAIGQLHAGGRNRIVAITDTGVGHLGRPFHVGELSIDDAMSLLATAVPDATPGDVRRAIASVGQRPLALRLAGGLMGRYGIGATLDRWRAQVPALTADPIAALASVGPPPSALAVFPNAIWPAGAEAVAGLGADELAGWARRGWLERCHDGAYRLPHALRTYLARVPAGAAVERWRNFVAAQLQTLPAVGFGRLNVDALDVTHYLAAPKSWEQVARAPRIWLQWSRGSGSVDAFERYLAWARVQAGEGNEVSATLAFLHGGILAELRQLDRAEGLLRGTLAALAPNDPTALFGLEALGQTLFRGSRFEEAEGVLSQALALSAEVGAEEVTGALQASLGQVRLMAGRVEPAIASLTAGIAAKMRRGHVLLALPDQNALTLALIATERYGEALAIADEALNASRHLQERNLRPYLLHTRALALLEMGRSEEAYATALTAFEALLPGVHGAVEPLLKVTLARAIGARAGAHLDRIALRDAVARALQAGGNAAWYAVLAVAEALGDEGNALYDHLAAAPVEGHLRALALRRRRGLASGKAGEPRALLEVFAPWLLT